MRQSGLMSNCVKASCLLLVVLAVLVGVPHPTNAACDVGTTHVHTPAPLVPSPVSLTLSGWGWHVRSGCMTCSEYGNAVLQLQGSMIPRDNVTDVADFYLTGTLSLNTPDKTDNFTVELRGSKVKSTFFLKQVTGGSAPQIAEFEGVWFDYEEPEYVACEGHLGVPASDHVADVYVFALRNRSLDSLTFPETSWLGRLTLILDEFGNAMVAAGSQAQTAISTTLATLAQVMLWWAA